MREEELEEIAERMCEICYDYRGSDEEGGRCAYQKKDERVSALDCLSNPLCLAGGLHRRREEKRKVLLSMIKLLDELEARLKAARDKLLNELDHKLELERAKKEREP